MLFRQARIYDICAILTSIVVILLDQWTKTLVVAHLSPEGCRASTVSLLGKYLVLCYTQNSGAAFGLLSNNVFLVVFIVAAIAIISYLYLKNLNTGPLIYKLIFGLIIGGAIGNLLDRAHNGGYVVDFISFRIPEINYYFAVFNIADACISTGVFLLFVFILFNGFGRSSDAPHERASSAESGTLRTGEQDVQS